MLSRIIDVNIAIWPHHWPRFANFGIGIPLLVSIWVQTRQDRLKTLSIHKITTSCANHAKTNVNEIQDTGLNLLVRCSMQFDDVSTSCFGMQAIHILRDDEIDPTKFFKLCYIKMASIRQSSFKSFPSSIISRPISRSRLLFPHKLQKVSIRQSMMVAS